MDQVEQLREQLEMMGIIEEYASFRTECSAIVSYMSSIEYLPLGDKLTEAVANAKADFRKIRDEIAGGTPGDGFTENYTDTRKSAG